MVTKTIIANYGDPNLGKTKSVIMAYEKLQQVAEKEDVLYTPVQLNGDICVILTINGIKVGVSSQGDPWSAQKSLLDELVEKGCQIILTACRYYGVTERNVESFMPDYRVYWTCNARLYEAGTNPRVAPKGIQTRFNENWADEIANMIESWCYA